jgi:hypothetical protein
VGSGAKVLVSVARVAVKTRMQRLLEPEGGLHFDPPRLV